MSKRFWSLIIVIMVVAMLTSSIFVIREGKQALLFQMGHIKMQQDNTPRILTPGLHIKLPFVQRAHQFDMKLQSLSLNVPAHLPNSTLEGIAEYVVLWKIADLPLFYQRTGGQWQPANALLTQTLRGHLDLAPANWQPAAANAQAAALGAELGIQVVSITYKGLALSQNSLKSAYHNMIDIQQQEAKHIRVNGKLQADKIVNDAQAQSEIIIAEAQAEASKVRADGDTQAAKIYSDAYSHDPEFYAFLISLQAYAKTFNKQKDVLVLTPTMQFFNYFNQPQSGK